ncbi:hypothetical protein L7F22_015889 [Adiantum nelumboides]|nr:hypothetical protein [Adiantum nelumboides]
MNTIITSRAGKDLVSSLVSGLLTIGDRFGGALDGAARTFSSGFDRGLTARELVDEARRNSQLLPGIGHKIKSVTNPDFRVQVVKEFVQKNFEQHPLLDYALAVERVTTQKKDTLILNVDGCIAVCFVDMLRNSGAFTREEADEYINMAVSTASSSWPGPLASSATTSTRRGSRLPCTATLPTTSSSTSPRPSVSPSTVAGLPSSRLPPVLRASPFFFFPFSSSLPLSAFGFCVILPYFLVRSPSQPSRALLLGTSQIGIDPPSLLQPAPPHGKDGKKSILGRPCAVTPSRDLVSLLFFLSHLPSLSVVIETWKQP